ncbi:MAG: N-6 DNA methylase [Endomicrobiales bacterium]|nr:N-6 DNA methylase [Endomicrobiales bacterium]
MELLKQQAKENLSKLIKKFEAEIASGEAYEYNEEATKMAFIEPLLKDVLGWDVNNHNEVCPEHKVSHKRVDYSLKIDGKDQLFIEAKSVKEDLENHIEQAVKYGYNRKDVSFVILTDFKDLMLFDVTIKPDKRNPKKGLKLKLTWQEYETKFDKLWLLSRESVISGELNNLLREKPKNQQPVDKAILKDLENWREALAKDLYKNNHHLFKTDDINRDADYLKEITQRILDRIIFMRFAEDRQLTHRPHLNTIFEDRAENIGTKAMIFLKDEFKHYDIIFNSDLFAPKEWERNLAVDFKVMKQIIEETYNPYEFDVIPLEVLGNIYEQYLGYTIRLTEQQVKFELKPDVRKAGGVYYTPEYIVDYIVKNTVGKMLNELSPAKAKKITILDPACGSGSFLIRAYSEMLEYYKNQKKSKIHSEQQSSLELNDTSGSVLSIFEKAEILRTHIFGVDIDAQAVEVTKLSLMFKMLDGEYGVVPGRAILPMLDKNIRCGNSLISGNTFELQSYFGEDYYKINAFNWEDRFSAVMSNGGFDVVIGNPPYVVLDADNKFLGYFKEEYSTAHGGKINLYKMFIERSVYLLKDNGHFGFICPSNYLSSSDSKELRKLLLENTSLREIIEYTEKDRVFLGVTQALTTLLFNKSKKNIDLLILKTSKQGTIKVSQEEFYKNPGFEFIFKNDVINKIQQCKQCFKDVIEGYQGEINVSINKELFSTTSGENKLPLLRGNLISHYNLLGNINEYCPTCVDKRGHWHFERVVFQEVSNQQQKRRVKATTIDKNILCGHTTNYCFSIGNNIDNEFILGLLNSKLVNYYFQFFNNTNHVPIGEIKNIPFCNVNLSNNADKEKYEKLIFLVRNILDLNFKTKKVSCNEKVLIQQQISQTDREIDELVYKLYGLTKDEINIIEKE